MIDRRSTAIHEAGHAIMMLRLDIPFSGVISIEPGEGYAGITTTDEIGCGTEEGARDAVLVYVASYAACAAAQIQETEASYKSDFDEAQRLIDEWKLDGLDIWKKRAVDIMSTPENKRAVCRLAKEILTDTTVLGELAAMVVRHSDGTATATDLAQCRDQFSLK